MLLLSVMFPARRRKGVACAILLALILSANHFCRDAPGTIETQLAEDAKLRVSPRSYAAMTAAYFLPSAFVPLALGILSSIPSEQGGVSSATVFVAATFVASLGNVIAALAVQWGSFPVLLVGRGVSGSVYEAVDMIPLGFMPALLPDLWGTTSGFINGMLRLGSVAAFASLPIVYNDVGGGGGEGGEDGERGGGTRAVFWCVALVGAVMWPLGAAVRHVAVGRADALLGLGGREVAADAAGGAEEEEKLPPVETSSTRGTCGTLGTAAGPDFGGADSSAETGRLEAADGPVDAALAALEADAVRVAADMNSQDVANTVYAYVTLGRMPGDETWAALETAAVRVAPNMTS